MNIGLITSPLAKICRFVWYMMWLAYEYSPIEPQLPYCQHCDNIHIVDGWIVNTCKGH